jgi:hypothetical protein
MHQHTSAYVSIRQHTSAYLSIPQHTSAYLSIPQHTSAYLSIPQQIHTYIHTYIHRFTTALLLLYYCFTTALLVPADTRAHALEALQKLLSESVVSSKAVVKQQ